MPSKPIKVLFVTKYMATQRHGPSRKAMLLLFKHKMTQNDEIELRFLTEDPPANNKTCYQIEISGWKSSSIFQKYFQSWSYHKKIVDIYRQWPFDIICFNDAQQAIFSTFLNIPKTIKLLSFINDDNSALKSRRVYDHLTRYFYRRIQRVSERHVARRADIVVCCSDYLSKLIKEQYDLSESPLTMRPAIDVAEWKLPPRSITARVPGTILFVKSEPRRGGLEVLLQALQNKSVKEKISHLHLGGFSNEQFQKEFIRHLPSSVEYTIHGHLNRPQLHKLVSTCHIGVVPSMYEAYGITAREFLAGGLITIVSNSGGLPEAVRGTNSDIFESHNAESLSTKLIIALSAGPQNRVSNLDEYSSTEMYQRFKEIIQSTAKAI